MLIVPLSLKFRLNAIMNVAHCLIYVIIPASMQVQLSEFVLPRAPRLSGPPAFQYSLALGLLREPDTAPLFPVIRILVVNAAPGRSIPEKTSLIGRVAYVSGEFPACEGQWKY